MSPKEAMENHSKKEATYLMRQGIGIGKKQDYSKQKGNMIIIKMSK